MTDRSPTESLRAGPGTAALLDGALAVPSPEAPPAARFGVCRLCRGPAVAGHATCWSCRRVHSQLGGRPARIVPLFLFSLGSGAHRCLVGYKAGVSAACRSARGQALGIVLADFLGHHVGCVVGGSCAAALIVPVPSTIGGRPSWGGRHPVGRLADEVIAGAKGSRGGSVDLRLVEALRAGDFPPRRLEARAAGFEVRPEAAELVGGATVVVLDDIFTSGARALSAAVALGRAGADVAAVVPIGRLVRPDHNAAAAAFFADRARFSWRPGSCAACTGPAPASVAHLAARGAVTTRVAA